jgi:hypothetical protein
MSEEKATLTPAEQEMCTDSIIMEWLVDGDAQRPWSVDEVAREHGDRTQTIDALARLNGVGLIHRTGEFVWATRAAVRASEIRL